MFELFYEPWVGDRYDKSSPRLLLLGESHYGADADQPDATIKNTQFYVDDKMNHRFWTNTMKTVLGPNSSVSRSEFWNGVAFYNYVQESVGAEPGDRPTKDQFKDSEAAFYEVLDRLQPQAILALGKTLWLNMPGTSERSRRGPTLDVAGEELDSWVYSHSEGTALTTWIRHPSRFFAWRSHDVANALIAACPRA